MTQVDHATIQAYLVTDYQVYGDCPFTLNIGKACAELSALHKTYHSSGSAFITAANPFSRPLDPVLNRERHISLARELAARGFPFIDGTGKHPSNLWPGEASFLVFGLTLGEARDLARKFHHCPEIVGGMATATPTMAQRTGMGASRGAILPRRDSSPLPPLLFNMPGTALRSDYGASACAA